jgi:histidinol-phosphate aminotransferase
MAAWEENVRRVEPYVPGEQPKLDNVIKLNTNENPYGPSPRVLEASLDFEKLRKYPDPTASLLVEKIAAYHGVKPSQVFVGVGSDDVIAMSFMTFFNSKKEILFPDITYSFYDVWAEMLRIPYRKVSVDREFRLVKEDYFGDNGGIIFPNPNAPTGIPVGLDFIQDILEHNRDVVVIIDEAYVDFGGETALPLLEKYENLLVIRTFSKSRSMAGLRIGYAIGNEKLISYLSDVKYSYNSYTMNMPSIILGAASIDDDAYFKETVAKVVNTREWFRRKLEEFGFQVLPSASNFVFATHPSYDATELFEAAKSAGIYFRHFSGERIRDYLRITIGTDEEMQAVVEFLQNYMK